MARRDDGATPLHMVQGQKDVFDLLLAKGADIDARTDKGHTPLSLAVASGNRELAKLLVAAGAPISVRRNDGATPVHRRAGQKDLFDLSWAKGADIGGGTT